MNRSRVLGIDIGGTKITVALAAVGGGIHIEETTRFATLRGWAENERTLYAAIDATLQKRGVRAEELLGIGVSCGGPLDAERGVIQSPPNLSGWTDVPITKLLSDRYGIPAFLENDANACALAEYRLGAGKGSRSMVFLTMGTGMGAGIIADGRLIRGAHGLAGEVGHLRLSENGPIGFHKIGSFEGWCSGGGIAQQAIELTERLTAQGKVPAWQNAGEPDSRVLADFARKGDADALDLFDRVGTRLGQAVALIADTIDPDTVVIGSIFARCEGLLRPAMEAALQKDALRPPRVMPAATGEEIGNLAAVITALEGLGIDPEKETEGKLFEPTAAPDAEKHLHRLLRRCPALAGCESDIRRAFGMLVQCFERGNKLLLCGNGGSCADCSHFAGELVKGFYLKRPFRGARRDALSAALADLDPNAAGLLQQGLPCIALPEMTALSTAFGNDVDPALTFAQQTAALGRAGDVLIGISTSGNARNVRLAIRTAKAMGLCAIAMTGESGGAIGTEADCVIHVPAQSPADVQELHQPVYHTLCAMLETAFFGEEDGV